MLVHRLRRRPTIKPALVGCLMWGYTYSMRVYVYSDTMLVSPVVPRTMTPVLLIQERCHAAMQSQKAVTAYFSSEQLLPFDFAERYTRGGVYSTTQPHPGSHPLLNNSQSHHRIVCWHDNFSLTVWSLSLNSSVLFGKNHNNKFYIPILSHC